MRIFQLKQDFKISEQDGSVSKNVSVQLHVNEENFSTGNILEFLDVFTENSQQLILDECSNYGRENNSEDYEAEEGWGLL